MSNSRHDVQRLFRHFGLDPSQYVELRGRGSIAAVSSSMPASMGLRADRSSADRFDADLSDYRSYELGG